MRKEIRIYSIGTFEIVCVSYNCNLKYRQHFKSVT